jgi:hypothetical protein
MYYKLDTDLAPDVMNTYVRALNNRSALLDDGALIDVDAEEIELPFKYTMKVRRNEDGTRQELRMAVYYPGKELMQKELVDVLRRTGIDNLQTFPARIQEDESDLVVDDYLVVNVIGLVACADQEESESMPFVNGEYFTKLVIDPARIGELRMFRLAESQMDVIVHEDVAIAIAERRFPGLLLIPVE